MRGREGKVRIKERRRGKRQCERRGGGEGGNVKVRKGRGNEEGRRT